MVPWRIKDIAQNVMDVADLLAEEEDILERQRQEEYEKEQEGAEEAQPRHVTHYKETDGA